MASGGSSLRKPTLHYYADAGDFRLAIERRSDGWYLLAIAQQRGIPLYYGATLSLEGAKDELLEWVRARTGEALQELQWREEYS